MLSFEVMQQYTHLIRCNCSSIFSRQRYLQSFSRVLTLSPAVPDNQMSIRHNFERKHAKASGESLEPRAPLVQARGVSLFMAHTPTVLILTQVAIGYVGAAGVVVSIITFYYVTSYDPEQDPFRRPGNATAPNSPIAFKPNSFDVCILGLKGKIRRWLGISRWIKPRNEFHGLHNQRLENAFIKVRGSLTRMMLATFTSSHYS